MWMGGGSTVGLAATAGLNFKAGDDS